MSNGSPNGSRFLAKIFVSELIGTALLVPAGLSLVFLSKMAMPRPHHALTSSDAPIAPVVVAASGPQSNPPS